MEFIWNDEQAKYGSYWLKVIKGEEQIMEIHMKDHSSEHEREYDAKNHHFRSCAFEVSECNWGRANDFSFDYDPDYDNHTSPEGETLYGYQGNCTHTVADVKRWCEEYAAHFFIIDYEEMHKKLLERKKISDELKDKGYTGIIVDPYSGRCL